MNKNCVLTVLQLFKKINFRHFFAKFTFRVYIPGKSSLSGYIYPESDFKRKNLVCQNFLGKNIAECIFTFSLSGSIYPESEDFPGIYVYPESDHFPGIYTRKVTQKNYTFANNSTKSVSYTHLTLPTKRIV